MTIYLLVAILNDDNGTIIEKGVTLSEYNAEVWAHKKGRKFSYGYQVIE